MKEGWICPRCGKVNAPFMSQCTCKSNNSPASNFGIECIHDWVWDGTNSDTSNVMSCVMYKYHCIKCGKSLTTPQAPWLKL